MVDIEKAKCRYCMYGKPMQVDMGHGCSYTAVWCKETQLRYMPDMEACCHFALKGETE